MNTQRTKVTFDLNVPQLLTLEFDPPAQPRPGKWGVQYMYWLAEEKTLWADPELHARIKATGAAAGDRILITKRKAKTQFGTYAITWSAQRVDDADLERAKAALNASTAVASIDGMHIRQPTRPRSLPPAKPLDKRLPPEKFAPPASAQQPPPASSLLTTCIREAMAAVDAAHFAAGPEDVRAFAITLYIQASGGRR